jgi:PEP-CTERM motif
VQIRRLFAVLGLCWLATPAAAATIVPSVGIVVDGVLVSTINAQPDPDGGDGWIIDQAKWGSELLGAEITVSAFLDPDPSILYAASVIDFGAPSTFGFIFIQPIVATAAPGVATHTHSSSTTGGGGSTAPVTAAAPPGGISVDGDATPEIAVYSLSTNGGTTWLNAGMDLSPSFVGAAPSDTQGPFNEGPIAGPAGSGSYDAMRVDVNFAMAGGTDAYTFNGEATINVPEPSVAALLAVGLGGLFAFGTRRR